MVRAEEVSRELSEVARKAAQEIATPDERLTNVREGVKMLTLKGEKTDEAINELRTKIAVVEERLNELKKALEESVRRKWAIVPNVVGALITAALGWSIALLGQRKGGSARQRLARSRGQSSISIA